MADSGTVASQGLWSGALKAKSAYAPVPSSLRIGATPVQPPTHPHGTREEAVERVDNRRLFVAVSPAMREVRRQVEQVASIDGVVLLLGESGTGKEVVARMIHKLSSRSARKFLKVNCAALPMELLESELFGHEGGAFSGARQARAGKFEICHKGTILLDEIADMPVSPQAKLLHVLQDGEFSRLGSASTIHSDVRVLAATNVDVRKAVQNGTLRADLYYRLNVFTIHLPPLRERREDLPHLLQHFMNNWAASYGRPPLPITRRILEACASYPWPGNVRELENFVKRYLVLGDEKLAVSQLDFRQGIVGSSAGNLEEKTPARNGNSRSSNCNLKSLVRGLKQDAERAAIVHALEQTHGNRQDAAGLLQISLRGLHYKIRAYGIESASSRTQSGTGMRDSAGMRQMPSPMGANAGGAPGTNSGKLISMDRGAWPPPEKLF